MIRINKFDYFYNLSENKEDNLKLQNFISKYTAYFFFEMSNIEKNGRNYTHLTEINYKAKEIKNVFDLFYNDFMNSINNNKNYITSGQKDGIDLENSAILDILTGKIQKNNELDFISLMVDSFLNFKILEKSKKEGIDYKNKNIYFQQKSISGELFDFAFKIVVKDKVIFKIFQITDFKSEKKLKNYLKEKLEINFSYIKKIFENKNTGNIDYFYFSFIISKKLYDCYKEGLSDSQVKYNLINNCCKSNGYELLIYDIYNSLLFIEQNNNLVEYTGLYEKNQKIFQIEDLNKIFEINKKYKICSLRKVKKHDIIKEDVDILNLIKKN